MSSEISTLEGLPEKALRSRWRKVMRARELLATNAVGFVRDVKAASRVAASKGNHAPAAWALEHLVGTDDDGHEVRPIAASIDRPSASAGAALPAVNIGFVIGGVMGGGSIAARPIAAIAAPEPTAAIDVTAIEPTS